MTLTTRYDVPESSLCPGCGTFAPGVALCAACTVETARAVRRAQQDLLTVSDLPASAFMSWPAISNPLMAVASTPAVAAVSGPITPPWGASNGGDCGAALNPNIKVQLTLLWAGTITALIAILLNPPMF